MQSHPFLSSFLSFNLSLLSSPRKIAFSFFHIFLSVAWLYSLNIFKLEGFLSFSQNFLFPWEEVVTLKLFLSSKVDFFSAGSFSKNREVFKDVGLIR
jgi:hypothetical protein